MFRALWKIVVTVLGAALAGAAFVLALSPNPRLTLEEWTCWPNADRYDSIIVDVCKKYDVDPMLVKAIVWRESGYRREMIGKNGERGLMQITEPAAREWVRAQKIENFVPADLFDAKTNLDAGTWYLKKSIERWKAKDDPLVFALAEYNAGHARVQQWIDNSNMGKDASSSDLLDSVSFPGVKKYIDSVLSRRDFFKKRGRL